MNTDHALNIAQGTDNTDSEPYSVGEALCVIDEKLDAAKFNWITGQAAYNALRAAFLADPVDEIHAVKGWERKVKLYKLAFTRSSFKAFWLQFGVNDRYQKQEAHAQWKQQKR